MLVKDVFNKSVISINKKATIEEATQLMMEKRVGGLPVVDDENSIVGMLTEKDIIARHKEIMPVPHVDVLGVFFYLEDPGRANKEFKRALAVMVEDAMSTPVYSVSPEDEIDVVLELMVTQGYNRIPVEENGELVGIIAREDLLKSLVTKQ
ncbi:CBS domain-containing protein [Alkalicella caledoniensis]|uniref:CBS domain-containing protein n=1 Tax=Alkalicella caledoniensis TaxID=2731377 RepID=A0A7G9W7B2_ALKCA|nr:CBS domain-containing protein [Alkalicella caledoniensis]QNO14574.1 CBS domain-containing protein [Alkalicella caledoniensis]